MPGWKPSPRETPTKTTVPLPARSYDSIDHCPTGTSPIVAAPRINHCPALTLNPYYCSSTPSSFIKNFMSSHTSFLAEGFRSRYDG